MESCFLPTLRAALFRAIKTKLAEIGASASAKAEGKHPQDRVLREIFRGECQVGFSGGRCCIFWMQTHRAGRMPSDIERLKWGLEHFSKRYDGVRPRKEGESFPPSSSYGPLPMRQVANGGGGTDERDKGREWQGKKVDSAEG